MSDINMDLIEDTVKLNKKLIRKYFLVQKQNCVTVADVLLELGGVYSFHPVLKSSMLAKHIYKYYRANLIETSENVHGTLYYIEEVSSDDKCNQLMCCIVKTKRKRCQRERMVLRAVLKVIVPGPPSVGFVRVYDLPCKNYLQTYA